MPRGNRETRDLQYIDKHIFKESKTKRKNLPYAWIKYKKAYDMVPQSWIIDCLEMYKISDMEETLKNWKVELVAGEKAYLK